MWTARTSTSTHWHQASRKSRACWAQQSTLTCIRACEFRSVRKAGAARPGAEVAVWLPHQNAAFEINPILYRLPEDSRSSPPEYSQNFSVDFQTGKLRKYGCVRDLDD